ncbi:MAG: AmmeMemoRadiSam system protein B [candidate division WOR-3 bacterium]|nr:AmmeMemoRadiSam system protein B [candidate division WOR-3 bacterium]
MNIRSSVFAGRFYPADSSELKRNIGAMIEKAKRNRDSALKTGIVPHAGIIYSGWTAAHLYSMIDPEAYERIVFIGPSHHHLFSGFAVTDYDKWNTPLGPLDIDRDFQEGLISGSIIKDNRVHDNEHSLEVQMPFVRYIAGDKLKVVPILMGRQDRKHINIMLEKIAEMNTENTLFIASSDLYHGYDYDEGNDIDNNTIGEIEQNSMKKFMDYFVDMESENTACCCGGGPIGIILGINRMNNLTVRLLNHSTSSDIAGDYSGYNVGYAAFGGFGNGKK